MKIPVLRGMIGNWRYYVGIMTFEQINEHVTASIGELYQATCLDELLQRELTSNFKSIKEYILNDEERFFNALILAIYNGDPQWLEVEFRESERMFTNVGFLQFSGNETIFPVDGQHRVAGIKEALKEKPELKNEQVPVVFIAHKNTDDGKKVTRKLFSTLNRRAKPVGQNENIALDEDDVCSIITRDLIQSLPLFAHKNVVNSLGKQIPATNESAFTSLITLYQCVDIILKWKLSHEGIKGQKYKDYLLYRPSTPQIETLRNVVFEMIESFSQNTTIIQRYLASEDKKKAAAFRNKQGGYLLFRPIALTEYFSAALTLVDNGITYDEAFAQLNLVNLNIAEKPWKGFLWDGSKMINRVSRSTIRNLLIYMVNPEYLPIKEYDRMLQTYQISLNIDAELAKQIFQEIARQSKK